MPATKPKPARRRKPAPAPAPPPPVQPVTVAAVLCRSDCPQHHRPHADAWPVQCDCGHRVYACGECLRRGRITGCVQCMAARDGA